MQNKSMYWILGVALLLGLSFQGYQIGKSLERFRNEDRSIAVKGFSEREVKSDFAVWTLKTRITTNQLAEGSAEVERSKSKILYFLQSHGVKPDEIVQQHLMVTDKLARDYGQNETGGFRYIIENAMQVRTSNVDTIQKVSRMTDELLKAGVVIANTYDFPPAVQFQFTGLNEIKPDMLSEATRNARQAATEFTRESGVKLGNLKKASQGLFTIVDRDASNAAGQGGYAGSGVSDLYKKVRVVVNVEYSIE